MERMSLREAAERTSRSVTTLRRYIRNGRLHAEKRYGRFGPEYFVADSDLIEAGLHSLADAEERQRQERRAEPLNKNGSVNGNVDAGGAVVRRSPAKPPAPRDEVSAGNQVPLHLYEDLQMKHEQLLVQYGMMRASGLRVMELQAQSDDRQRRLEDAQGEIRRLKRDLDQTRSELRAELRQTRLELEARDLEIAALQEKVRALEMLTRNAVTNETIDKQFEELRRQQQRVRALTRPSGAAPPKADH